MVFVQRCGAGTVNYSGVDGCKGGWLIVTLDPSARTAEHRVMGTFREVVEVASASQLTLVDIPIGLPGRDGPRERPCDREARKLLGGRRGSVFPVPSREAIQVLKQVQDDAALPFREACRRASAAHQNATGRKLSFQSCALIPRIREVDSILSGDPSIRERIRETHPEVCFWALNEGRPLTYSKRTDRGFQERVAIVQKQDPWLGHFIDRARQSGRDFKRDDLIDAIVCAITAWKWAGHTLPEAPPRDERGLKMEILYARQALPRPGPGTGDISR